MTPDSRKTRQCDCQDCPEKIPPWFELCVKHNDARKNGTITPCESCNKYKSAKYKTCYQCSVDERAKGQRPRLEHSNRWRNQDAGVYFVYILKLDGGSFYAGQTDDLRLRMTEHRDGKTVGTKGRNPKLVWFHKAGNRQEAVEDEAYLKILLESNDREVRRMVTEFLDLVKEVDTKTLADPSRRLRYGR